MRELQIEELKAEVDQVRELFKEAPHMTHDLVRGCQVIVDRHHLLDVLPKRGVCAEIGVLFGEYSQEILDKTDPSEFHLFDIEPGFLEHCERELKYDSSRTQISTHCGDSSETLSGFGDDVFDWIYIDAEHTYDAVTADLAQAKRVVKDEGWIIANDYIFFDHSRQEKWGVVEAVNQFCLDFNYKMIYFVLHHQMYCDVVLKKA